MNYDVPPHVIELIQRQLSQFGRVGATKIYKAPDLSAAIAAAGANPTIAGPQNIRFREKGIVIACYGQERTGTAAKFAQTEVRVQIGGSEDLFTDGQSGTFVSLLSLVGGAQNWFPLWRRATPGIDWSVSYRNQDTGAAANPSFQFAFIADADVQRMAGR